jgi:hypothetical protein
MKTVRILNDIKPMEKASEAILKLKPVTFRYKGELDPAKTPQFGLIAEEVEKVNPDLIVRDEEGKAYTVRYDAVNAMLLNEFLKEHRKVEQQRATIAKQQKEIEALTTGLQKVNDKLELSKPAPRTVNNKARPPQGEGRPSRQLVISSRSGAGLSFPAPWMSFKRVFCPSGYLGRPFLVIGN